MTRPTKRQELGKVLYHHRHSRGLNTHETGDRIGASKATVEDFEEGKDVPNPAQWGRYCNLVNRKIGSYRALWTEARVEGTTSKVATNLGDKLAHLQEAKAIIVQERIAVGSLVGPPKHVLDMPSLGANKVVVLVKEPAPVKSPTSVTPIPEAVPVTTPKQPISLPPGFKAHDRQVERETWIRGQFMARPNMPISGADGMRELVRQRFGAGVSHDVAVRIKDEVRAELMQRSVNRTDDAGKDPVVAPVVATAVMPGAHGAPKATTAADVKAAIKAATELLMETVPNLAEFLLVVGEDGKPAISYKTRERVVRVEVVEAEGSFTL